MGFPTCATVQLVLDGVLDFQLDLFGHVVTVRNVPAHTQRMQAKQGL